VKFKRAIAALAIFSLSSIGVTYAAGTDTNAVQNFFLGGSDLGSPNLNQVLALLVGPKGEPGAAGVAGADGFVGMNGQDGKNGLDGAPGLVGPQGPAGEQGAAGERGPAGATGAQGPAGASVASSVVLTGSGQPCNGRGGTKFTDAAGTITYACNGANGTGEGGSVTVTELPANNPNCVNGGTQFDDGQGGITYACNGAMADGNLGLGNIALSSCDADVRIGIRSDFNGVEFSLANITLSNVNAECSGSSLEVYIPIKTSGVKKGSTNLYRVSTPPDIIVCSINSVTVNSGSILVSDATASCKVKRTDDNITFAEINAQDVGSNIGLTLSS